MAVRQTHPHDSQPKSLTASLRCFAEILLWRQTYIWPRCKVTIPDGILDRDSSYSVLHLCFPKAL